MVKNSVLSKPTHQAHLSKRGFNMSQKLEFTSSTGHLLPVYYDYLNPSEKVRISNSLFTRTQPLATAAMIECEEYVDWFFVPMTRMLSNFDAYITGVDDFTSSKLRMDVSSSLNYIVPRFPTDQVTDNSTNFSWPSYLAGGDFGDSQFDSFWGGFVRLIDHLGWPVESIISRLWNSQTSSYDELAGYRDYRPNVNLLTLGAYQCIYYDYYRLSSWQPNNVFAYNFDTLVSDMDLHNNAAMYTGTTYAANLKALFTLRHRPYARDYFKALEPAPLVATTGMLSSYFSQRDIRLWTQNGISPQVRNPSHLNPLPTGDSGSLVTNTTSQLTNVSIRSLFAVEKMMRITGMSGKHYDDQILAHFGFKVPQGISKEVYFIGSHRQRLRIGEVIATADSGNSGSSQLGQVAGKGYSKGDSREFTFTAPCHGVLMAIYSCIPIRNYIYPMDKINTALTRYDFYQPELDNLGMQPMFGFECMTDNAHATDIFAWQPRYMQFKTKADRATHAFAVMQGGSQSTNANGPFRHWSNARVPNMGQYAAGDGRMFYCTPNELDNVMLQGFTAISIQKQDLFYNTDWAMNLYSSDPLIHDLQMNVYKVSPMSTFGIEQL